MIHDDLMRTTLTIDDDLAAILQQKARQRGVAFKQLVNSLLRSGLGATEGALPKRKMLKVVGRPLGMKTRYDSDKLNQLVDELEADRYLTTRRWS